MDSSAVQDVLLEFRAGKMHMVGTRVVADPRKGLVRIGRGEERLVHFQWLDRSNNVIEDDQIVFPEEAVFEKVAQASGRVYILKFHMDDRKCFFWMQEPKADKDVELCNSVNRYLNQPIGVMERNGGNRAPRTRENLRNRRRTRENLRHRHEVILIDDSTNAIILGDEIEEHHEHENGEIVDDTIQEQAQEETEIEKFKRKAEMRIEELEKDVRELKKPMIEKVADTANEGWNKFVGAVTGVRNAMHRFARWVATPPSELE